MALTTQSITEAKNMATKKFQVVAHLALIVEGKVRTELEELDLEEHIAAPLVAAGQLVEVAVEKVEVAVEAAKDAAAIVLDHEIAAVENAVGEAKFGE
jgi:hypothetical protein